MNIAWSNSLYLELNLLLFRCTQTIFALQRLTSEAGQSLHKMPSLLLPSSRPARWQNLPVAATGTLAGLRTSFLQKRKVLWRRVSRLTTRRRRAQPRQSIQHHPFLQSIQNPQLQSIQQPLQLQSIQKLFLHLHRQSIQELFLHRPSSVQAVRLIYQVTSKEGSQLRRRGM